MENYLEKEIGGKVRGFKFTIGSIKCLAKLIDVDPLQFAPKSEKWEDVVPYAIKIIHACLLGNCMSRKEEPDFTEQDVEAWVNEWPSSDIQEIIVNYNNQFITKTAKSN